MYRSASHEIPPCMTVVHQIYLLDSGSTVPEKPLALSGKPRSVGRPKETMQFDETGRVISFCHRQTGVVYQVEYDRQGQVQALESSDGWFWRRIIAGNNFYWQVGNYFDRWQVSSEACRELTIDKNGVNAAGKDPEQMCLPAVQLPET
jgi:hypothetical protein